MPTRMQTRGNVRRVFGSRSMLAVGSICTGEGSGQQCRGELGVPINGNQIDALLKSLCLSYRSQRTSLRVLRILFYF